MWSQPSFSKVNLNMSQTFPTLKLSPSLSDKIEALLLGIFPFTLDFFLSLWPDGSLHLGVKNPLFLQLSYSFFFFFPVCEALFSLSFKTQLTSISLINLLTSHRWMLFLCVSIVSWPYLYPNTLRQKLLINVTQLRFILVSTLQHHVL